MSVKSVTLAVAVAVLSASTALAQGWHDYISRDEFFLVSMPSEPQITSTTYRAASGAMLPAKQFVATEGQRRYTVTVVHYMNASAADEAAAVEHAVRSFRNRPAQVTYDRAQVIEGVPGPHDLPLESRPEPRRGWRHPASEGHRPWRARAPVYPRGPCAGGGGAADTVPAILFPDGRERQPPGL